MTKKINERKARQGLLGMPVLAVLVGGLLLAFIAWGAVEIFGYMIAPETPIGDPQTTPGSASPDQGN